MCVQGGRTSEAKGDVEVVLGQAEARAEALCRRPMHHHKVGLVGAIARTPHAHCLPVVGQLLLHTAREVHVSLKQDSSHTSRGHAYTAAGQQCGHGERTAVGVGLAQHLGRLVA